MYRIFGWINVALVAMMLLPLFMRWLNSRFIKNDIIKQQLNKYRVLHKIFGALLLASIIVHAVLALRSWLLHSGMLLGISAGLTVIAAVLFYTVKKKWLFVLHRVLAVATVVLLLVHLIFPSVLQQLF